MQRKPTLSSTNNHHHHHHHHLHHIHHHQACAACKHQRKKCTDKCVLAPFFPASKSREFQAVHRVFGVSNVQKIIRSLADEDDRRRATESLVWEALCRQRDPVLGPYGEYRKVYDELKLYKLTTHHHHAQAMASLSQVHHHHHRAAAAAAGHHHHPFLGIPAGQPAASIAHHQLYRCGGGDEHEGGGVMVGWDHIGGGHHEQLMNGKMMMKNDGIMGGSNTMEDNGKEMMNLDISGHNHDHHNGNSSNKINNNHCNSMGLEGQSGAGSIANSSSVSSYGGGGLICSNNKEQINCGNGRIHEGKIVAGRQMPEIVVAPGDSVVVIPSSSSELQNHPVVAAGFNPQQQYFLSGQLSPLDGKSMESTIWESPEGS